MLFYYISAKWSSNVLAIDLSVVSAPQVSLLWNSGEGDLPVLWRDVLQKGSGVGERDGEERGHEADSGVFTALQTGDAPARVSKCQRPKFACQPARRKGKQEF